MITTVNLHQGFRPGAGLLVVQLGIVCMDSRHLSAAATSHGSRPIIRRASLHRGMPDVRRAKQSLCRGGEMRVFSGEAA